MDSTSALETITLGQHNCKVFGRLLRLWDAVNVKSKFADPFISIDGVLLDEHGAMAQLSVPKRFQKQFRPLLKEGHVYMFTDVAAVDIKNKTYIYHHQKYMLQFKPSTKVHRLENRGANIPNFSFKFCPFDKLPEMDIMARPLQDIIGVIRHVGPFDYASATSQNKLRIIKIRNLDDQIQEIRLWGNHGETFDEEAVLKKSQSGVVVGIFTGLTAGNFLGSLTISSNSATKIYIDLDTPEVNSYRTSYQWASPPLQQQLPQVVPLSPIQAAGKLYTLQEISTLPASSFQERGTISTIAEVQSIVPTTNWYYKGCSRCDKGYNNNSDTPTCLCVNSSSKPLYKLPVTLADKSGKLDAIAFTTVAEELVERDAVLASQNMKIDPSEHVIVLNNAIGKTRLFNIGMKADSSSRFPINYVIRKCFSADNAPMIPSVKAPASQQLIIKSSPVTNNQSSKDNTPEDLNDSTPLFREPAAITTDKTTMNQSTAKRSIQFTEQETTSQESGEGKRLQDGELEFQTVKRPKQDISGNNVSAEN